MGRLVDKFGYRNEEIDEYAKDIFSVLTDWGLPPPLMLLSLCRAITILATDQELDIASALLDELREEPADEFADLLEGIDELSEEEDDDEFN